MAIFVDSCVLIAFANSRDSCHEEAKKILENVKDLKYGKPFISDYIFSEVVTVLLQKTKDLGFVSEYGKHILEGELDIQKVEDDIFEAAWQIFQDQGKTGLSFTDCTNLALMKTHSINRIATFDKAFESRKDIGVVG